MEMANLLCNEGESSLIASRQDGCLEFCCVSESDREFIEASLLREADDFRRRCGDVSVTKGMTRSRSDAIKWILETRALFGYIRVTAYLSLIYFDRFLMKRMFNDEKLWQTHLLSIACLSLAAKMEEREVRALSEYQVDEYQFEGKMVQRMELLVLSALEWKMSYVTPFAYLNYFAVKLCGESIHKEHVSRASDLVLAIMEEINVAEHRPSIIAAAAVLASYDCHLTKTTLENKMEAIPSWGSLEKEHTLSCYTVYQEIMASKTPKSIISLSVTSSVSFDDGSPITSRGSVKRRIEFDDDDDDRHSPAEKVTKL